MLHTLFNCLLKSEREKNVTRNADVLIPLQIMSFVDLKIGKWNAFIESFLAVFSWNRKADATL